jgi:TolB-like protein
VDAIVEGTVHAGSRVRITAHVIQVSADMHLWADSSSSRAEAGGIPTGSLPTDRR